MEFSRSERGNKVLIYMGFEYLQYRTVKGIVTWRCRQNRSMNCHSIVKTENDIVIQEPTQHCHDSCPQKAEANMAKSQMKEDMKAPSATPRHVIGNMFSQLSTEVLAHFPKHSSLARNLRKHRESGHLPNPKTASFNIPEKYSQLVLHDSGMENQDRILALGDKVMVDELNKDTIYGDGTFDRAPNTFFQLYTWHAQVGNSFPPCIYFLLQKTNLESYVRMFKIMLMLVPSLAPHIVLLDFEVACMSAAKNTFPKATVKGCYFHLSQSLTRKVNNIGLESEFDTDINIKLKLKSLAALSFVPAHEVRDVFDRLATTFPDEHRYNEVLTYFLSTYIEGPVLQRIPQCTQFIIPLYSSHHMVTV